VAGWGDVEDPLDSATAAAVEPPISAAATSTMIARRMRSI